MLRSVRKASSSVLARGMMPGSIPITRTLTLGLGRIDTTERRTFSTCRFEKREAKTTVLLATTSSSKHFGLSCLSSPPSFWISPTSRLLSTSTHSNEALGSQVPDPDAVADASKDETILVTNATGTCVSPPPSTLISEEQASKQTQNQGGPDPAYQPPEGALETIKHWIRGYASLSKFKLSSLVLATTMFGYYMAPVPIILTPFVASSVGTALTIFSACSINQIMEISNDAKMLRTKTRWLPSQRISTPHAIGFSAVTGISGFMLLYHVVNPLAAILATGNLVLYTAIYTPMKQTRPINTWVGAIVGAVPPMIGWASATGGLEAGSWVLGSFLGAWQMPHFMALSYALKDDYQRGGFKMLINVSPDKVPGVTLRYSIAMMLLGPFSFLAGITSQWFVFDSLIPTSYLLYLAIRFYKNPSPTDARKIFRYTLLLLPVLMGLMIFHQTDSPNLLEAGSESDDAKSTTETKDEKL